MRNLLAIVGDYYPHPSSNTNCFNPLLCGLEKAGWHIDIVTVKQWFDLPDHEVEESGREIWRINDPRSMNTILQNQAARIPAPRFLRFVNKCFATVSKAFFYLRYCLFQPEKRYAGWSRSAAVKKCLELHNDKSYEIVLSISHPVACHEIAQKFLNALNEGRPKWVLYELDPFCYNEHIYGKNCYAKLAPKQHMLFSLADGILVLPELYDLYRNTPFAQYMDKLYPILLPNMKPVNFRTDNAAGLPLADNRVNCIFGGAFGTKIRNPAYALDTFSRCSTCIRWTIMTGFAMDSFLDNIDDIHDVIRVYPMQLQDTAYSTMLRADILVNIGNTVSFQTPGKIFEYMAMGKPIIHFQKTVDDPCLKYFKDYPMVLIINELENDPVKHAQMIEEFCRQNQKRTLSFEEVSQIIPQYTSKQVVNGFVQLIDNIANEANHAKE